MPTEVGMTRSLMIQGDSCRPSKVSYDSYRVRRIVGLVDFESAFDQPARHDLSNQGFVFHEQDCLLGRRRRGNRGDRDRRWTGCAKPAGAKSIWLAIWLKSISGNSDGFRKLQVFEFQIVQVFSGTPSGGKEDFCK